MTKKLISNSLVLAAGALSSSLALADTGSGSTILLAPLAAGLAIGLGAFGAATAQGRTASAAMEGITRNPTSKGDVLVPMILSLVFMEFQALLSFIVALMLLK